MRNSIRFSFGTSAFALGHRLLHLDRTAHRVDNARKLDQQVVTGGLDDATMRPLCSLILGSASSLRSALRRWSVPSSSAPISRESPPRRRRGLRRDGVWQPFLPRRSVVTSTLPKPVLFPTSLSGRHVLFTNGLLRLRESLF
jgi:hypothetical protein